MAPAGLHECQPVIGQQHRQSAAQEIGRRHEVGIEHGNEGRLGMRKPEGEVARLETLVAGAAAIEKAEVLVIQDYLPKALSDEEITAMVESAIAETGAEGVSGMGKVMAVLKGPMQGRADMTLVSGRVKALLGV